MPDFQTPIEAENFARQLARTGGPRGAGGQFHVAYNWGYEDERRKILEASLPRQPLIPKPIYTGSLDIPQIRRKGPFDL